MREASLAAAASQQLASGQQAQQPRLHPRYKDPTYQEAEVSVPASTSRPVQPAQAARQEQARSAQQQQQQWSAGQGFGQPQAKFRGRKQAEHQQQAQQAAQEVDVEVVDPSLEDESDSDSDEGYDVLAAGAFAAATSSDGGRGQSGSGHADKGSSLASEEERAGPAVGGEVPELPYATLGVVPRSSLAFLKEVIAVNSAEKR